MTWDGYTFGRAYYHDEKGERYYYEDGEKVMAVSFKEATNKMPCGHPRGCVVSRISKSGAITTPRCAWCADIARAQAAEKQLAEAQARIQKDAQEIVAMGTTALEGYLKLQTAQGRIAELEAERQGMRDHIIVLEGHADNLEAILESGKEQDESREARARITETVKAVEKFQRSLEGWAHPEGAQLACDIALAALRGERLQW